jgi:mRNA interferase MazF
MVDQPLSVRRHRIGKPFGNLEDEALLRVNRALAVWIGLA